MTTRQAEPPPGSDKLSERLERSQVQLLPQIVATSPTHWLSHELVQHHESWLQIADTQFD